VQVTGPKFERVAAKQVMNRVNFPQMPFTWSLNPYRGCTHGCSFCYARETHSFMGLSPDDTFQKHIFVKDNAPEVLERQLERLARKHHYNLRAMAEEIGLLCIGTATDPYQPIEARAKLTRSCLEVLARYSVPVTITTRSPLILRDLDLLKRMDVRSVNISVNTLNRKIWRDLEPASPAPGKRLETVRELVRYGVNAGILLAPIVPFLTDSELELETVVRAAREYQARFVSPSVLRLAPDVKTWFLRTIGERYPELLPKYRQLYRTAFPSRTYADALMRRVRRLMRTYGVSSHSGREAPVDGPELQGSGEGAEAPRVPVQLTLPL
jgi:DNA repair photolyase